MIVGNLIGVVSVLAVAPVAVVVAVAAAAVAVVVAAAVVVAVDLCSAGQRRLRRRLVV